MSGLFKSGLIRSLHEPLPFCKVKIVFKISNHLKHYFSSNDVDPEPLRSCQIYKFYNFVWKPQCLTHKLVKALCTWKSGSRNTKEYHYKQVNIWKELCQPLWRDHMLNCNHVVAWDDFQVLGRDTNHWLLEIKESLFIKRYRPSLNRNIYSQ